MNQILTDLSTLSDVKCNNLKGRDWLQDADKTPDLLHCIAAESSESQESLRSWICLRTTGTPSAEVFLCTASPLVMSIFSWISRS